MDEGKDMRFKASLNVVREGGLLTVKPLLFFHAMLKLMCPSRGVSVVICLHHAKVSELIEVLFSGEDCSAQGTEFKMTVPSSVSLYREAEAEWGAILLVKHGWGE